MKIVFDIRCDLKGFQRYLNDATNLEVHLNVSSDSCKNNLESKVENEIKSQTQRIYTKQQQQQLKKKRWKSGDYIGKFTISHLKFNARGEYVDECSIFNSYGDHCGSIVVFILYTDKISVLKPLVEENLSIRNHSSFKKSSLHEQPSQQNHLKTRTQELSPRFVVFDKGGKDEHKKEKDVKSTYKRTPIPKAKLKQKESPLVRKSSIINNSILEEHSIKSKRPTARKLNINASILSTNSSFEDCKTKFLSAPYSNTETVNENFILTKLFTFVGKFLK